MPCLSWISAKEILSQQPYATSGPQTAFIFIYFRLFFFPLYNIVLNRRINERHKVLKCSCSLWQHQIWQCWFTNTCQMWCHWERSANSCVFRILSLKSPAVVKTHLALEKNLRRALCSASVSASLRLISHFLSVCLTSQKRYDQH